MKRLALLYVSIALAPCMTGCGAGSDSGGASGSSTFIFSCDGMVTGPVLTCVEHYAAPSFAPSIIPTWTSLCEINAGTKSQDHCPIANSVGSCTVTAAGAEAYGVFDKLFTYAPGTTVATAMSSCAVGHGHYLPPGQ